MTDGDFSTLCQSAFAAVIIRHHMKVASSRSDRDVWQWTLVNTTTGARVTYELRGAYLGVQIGQLVDGHFPRSVGEIGPETTLTYFDLLNLVALRGEMPHDYSLRSRLPHPDAVRDTLVKLANALDFYAADVLEGDFAVFARLELIVKERARQAAYQKWSGKAREFGVDGSMDLPAEGLVQ